MVYVHVRPAGSGHCCPKHPTQRRILLLFSLLSREDPSRLGIRSAFRGGRMFRL